MSVASRTPSRAAIITSRSMIMSGLPSRIGALPCPLPAFGLILPVDRSRRWARSSAGEHYVDIVGVTGSIPVAPTIVHTVGRPCGRVGDVADAVCDSGDDGGRSSLALGLHPLCADLRRPRT